MTREGEIFISTPEVQVKRYHDFALAQTIYLIYYESRVFGVSVNDEWLARDHHGLVLMEHIDTHLRGLAKELPETSLKPMGILAAIRFILDPLQVWVEKMATDGGARTIEVTPTKAKPRRQLVRRA